MKVLNLRCGHGHGFEGWFASEDDFQGQLARGLLECPLCGDRAVAKLPSAPRLNLLHGREPSPASAPGAEKPPRQPTPPAERPAAADAAVLPAELQAMWLKAMQQLVARTEDVGDRFPEEARRIHYGESPERGIRGQATPEERAELEEEGIEVMPLALPLGLKGSVQ